MWWLYSVFKYWKFIAILGLSGFIGWSMWQSERKNTEIHDLRSEIVQKNMYLESLEDAVDMQNGLIDVMAEKNRDFENRLDVANKRIVSVQKQEKQRIKSILATRTGETCESNMDFLLQHAQDEYKWVD